MLRLLIASLAVLLFVGDASACHRQPARRAVRAIVPHRAVHRERHVIRDRAPVARVVGVVVPKCSPMGCPAVSAKK